jgi:hypothetical protein
MVKLQPVIGKQELEIIKEAKRFIKQLDERSLKINSKAAGIFVPGPPKATKNYRTPTNLATGFSDAVSAFRAFNRVSPMRYDCARDVLFWRDKAMAHDVLGIGDNWEAEMQKLRGENAEWKKKAERFEDKYLRCNEASLKIEQERDSYKEKLDEIRKEDQLRAASQGVRNHKDEDSE